MKTVLVTYHSFAEFKLPDDVFLLSEAKNNQDRSTVGSWWILWNVFYYVDENLKVQKVDAGDIDTECKHPDTIEIVEEND